MSIESKNIIAVITARGGSKGIPGKNIKPLNGKPLIAYAIEAAEKSKYVDRVIVSTDDKKIADISKRFKAEVPFKRPAKLATDNAPTLPVLQHAVKYLEEKEKYRVDIVVLIQPTSPFVLPEDIDGAIAMLFKTKTQSCISLCEISEYPERMYYVKNNKMKQYLNVPKNTRRQDLPQLYTLNGAVYVTKKDTLIKKSEIISNNSSAIIMPVDRSYDIDKPIDFVIAETLMKHGNKNKK